MNKWSKVLLLTFFIGLIGSVAGGIEWHQTTDFSIYEDENEDELIMELGDEPVDSIEIADTQTMTTTERDDAVLATIHPPESSVPATRLSVVWSLPEGLWYDVQLVIEPAKPDSASFSDPVTNTYSDARFSGGEPNDVSTNSQIFMDFPLGSDHAATGTLIQAQQAASNETIEYETRLTAHSLTGESIEVTSPFEIEYSQF